MWNHHTQEKIKVKSSPHEIVMHKKSKAEKQTNERAL